MRSLDRMSWEEREIKTPSAQSVEEGRGDREEERIPKNLLHEKGDF